MGAQGSAQTIPGRMSSRSGRALSLTLTADRAASVSAARSQRSPLRVFPDLCLPALSCCQGRAPPSWPVRRRYHVGLRPITKKIAS